MIPLTQKPHSPIRVYAASSWQNPWHPDVVRALREAGFSTYDFRHPDGETQSGGFHWSDIDPEYKSWTPVKFSRALYHPFAQLGYHLDRSAMDWANWCVLVLPAGRSAHLEAGHFTQTGKGLIILQDIQVVPELMYKMADVICHSVEEVCEFLACEAGRKTKDQMEFLWTAQ